MPRMGGIFIWWSEGVNERSRTSINYYTYVFPPVSLTDYKRRIKYSNRSWIQLSNDYPQNSKSIYKVRVSLTRKKVKVPSKIDSDHTTPQKIASFNIKTHCSLVKLETYTAFYPHVWLEYYRVAVTLCSFIDWS